MSNTDPTETEMDDRGSDDTSGLSTTQEKPDIPDEEMEQLEKERQERLDPDNRPVNAEVDNTGREFDAVKGEFKYAAGEEPGAEERTTAVIGADRPEGVESDVDDD